MDPHFSRAVQIHRARYPQMEPQDYGKLAYQTEFGPQHMALEPTAALSDLQREWAAVPSRDSPIPVEDLGEGMCRFHLTGAYDSEQAAPLLAKLFLRTAQERRGSLDGLLEKLGLLHRLGIPGMDEWLAEYRRQGFPAVHHSEAFRGAHQPHYRLLSARYAHSFPALLAIDRLVQIGKPAVVAIDGRCGSGKTRFAALIQELIPCNVVHMDDFYLPMEERSAGWKDDVGGNIDFSRILSELLIPAKRGEPLCCRPYDCHAGHLVEATALLPRPLTVVEGSYSTHPRLAGQYDCTIFLTCSQEEQIRRLRTREDSAVPVFQHRWIPMEERYFKICNTQAQSDYIIDTSDFLI